MILFMSGKKFSVLVAFSLGLSVAVVAMLGFGYRLGSPDIIQKTVLSTKSGGSQLRPSSALDPDTMRSDNNSAPVTNNVADTQTVASTLCLDSNRDWADFLSKSNVSHEFTYSDRDIEYLVEYLSVNSDHLNTAIATALNEPDTRRRELLLESFSRLPYDEQVNTAVNSLVSSSRVEDRVAGINLVGSRDLSSLPSVLEQTLQNESGSQATYAALQWVGNIRDPETLERIRDTVNDLAFNASDEQIKGEALTSVLSIEQNDPEVLDHLTQLLTSAYSEEQNVALYALKTSQVAANISNEYWQDLNNTLNEIAKDENLSLESRLQSITILRDIEVTRNVVSNE